jgi:hypothetical protein
MLMKMFENARRFSRRAFLGAGWSGVFVRGYGVR